MCPRRRSIRFCGGTARATTSLIRMACTELRPLGSGRAPDSRRDESLVVRSVIEVVDGDDLPIAPLNAACVADLPCRRAVAQCEDLAPGPAAVTAQSRADAIR